MANEQLSMDNILDDEKKPEPAAPVAEAPAAAEPAKEAADEQRKEEYKSKRNQARDKEAIAQGKVRDPDTGQFVAPPKEPAAPTAEETAAKAALEAAKTPPAQDMTPKERAAFAKAAEETRKRQGLERELAALKAAQQPAAQPATPAEPAKTFWEDPEGMLAKHRKEIEQVGVNTRLQTSEIIARSRHPDFDEKLAVFSDFLEKANPAQQAALANQWLSSPDPAEYAYTFGKNQVEFQEVGNLDAMRAKIVKETEARVRIEVQAELKSKADAMAQERAALPPSLSDARAVSMNRPVWSGQPSMEDILK